MTTAQNPAYGTARIGPDWVAVEADGAQLYDWAHRTGHQWFCSTLADLDSIVASFDTHGLVELSQLPTDEDVQYMVSGDEFNAWSSDVLRATLPADHPCYFVTVGQFDAS